MDFNYYYNNVPYIGLTRNNLIYTSLISSDNKTFVQWYYNDTDYHKGQNQVVNPELMDEKWNREIYFLKNMAEHNPNMVPEILEIDEENRKIYLKIDGPDFWQRSLDKNECPFDEVLPDWQEQMLSIIKSHKDLGWHKYSMHPSSYFIIDGRLKSINYFFTYRKEEEFITIKSVESHIHSNRQEKLRSHLDTFGIKWDQPQSWTTMDRLCWESFRSNYSDEFINKVKECLK